MIKGKKDLKGISSGYEATQKGTACTSTAQLQYQTQPLISGQSTFIDLKLLTGSLLTALLVSFAFLICMELK